MGLTSGCKPTVANLEAGQPAVLVISSTVAGGQKDGRAVQLKNLDAKEQLAVLDQLKRSKWIGTAGGVETEIVKSARSLIVHLARLVTVPTQSISVGFGPYAHASFF